jgi:hypothetical protein
MPVFFCFFVWEGGEAESREKERNHGKEKREREGESAKMVTTG